MRSARIMLLVGLASACTTGRTRAVSHVSETDQPWPTGTFSILAYDSETGEIGAAVQSRVPLVAWVLLVLSVIFIAVWLYLGKFKTNAAGTRLSPTGVLVQPSARF